VAGLTLRVKHLLYCARDTGGVSTDYELVAIAGDQSHVWRWCGSHALRRGGVGLWWNVEVALVELRAKKWGLVLRACT